MAAVALGAGVAIVLAGPARRQERRSPVPPVPPAAVVVTSLLAIVACWAGERLWQLDRAVQLPELPEHTGHTELAVVAALVDRHTRWAAREGMPRVTAASAGVSGVILIVPLGWMMWPVIQAWLWPPDLQQYIVDVAFIPRWEALASGVLSLNLLLELVAVAIAALASTHRTAALVRGMRRSS